MPKNNDILKKNISADKTLRSGNEMENWLPFRKKRKGADSKSLEKSGLRLQWEIRFTQIAIFFTLIATVMLFKEICAIFVEHVEGSDYSGAGGQIVFATVVFFLIYGNIVYQFTRLGYFKRLKSHCRERRSELDDIYDRPAPSLTFLIPSYKEEPQVIRQSTLVRRPAGVSQPESRPAH